MKTWAIGDIHGCYKTLVKLLEELDTKGWDKIVFLGDYIDRGPESKKVIDLIRTLPNTVCLRGNHEDMCLYAKTWKGMYDRDLGSAWYLNGSAQTTKSFLPYKGIPDEYLDWMYDLKLCYEDKDAFYVHAGFRPGVSSELQSEYDMLWIRHEFLGTKETWGKPVIHGHTPMKKVIISDNMVSLDTGCVYGFSLSAYCPSTGESISVQQIDGMSL